MNNISAIRTKIASGMSDSDIEGALEGDYCGRADTLRASEYYAGWSTSSNDNLENFIKVAADSVLELRRVDVYRVLIESNRKEIQLPLAAYIRAHRPDLIIEVNEVLAEQAAEEARSYY
jgi:hypothetical protein